MASSRMTDERLAELRAYWYGASDTMAELLDALQAERAEVERLRAERDATLAADQARCWRTADHHGCIVAQNEKLRGENYTLHRGYDTLRAEVERLRARGKEA